MRKVADLTVDELRVLIEDAVLAALAKKEQEVIREQAAIFRQQIEMMKMTSLRELGKREGE